MNLKKTWKRFWTLSRRHDGFTLVELIVVIAILAILGGVGVPAYSGYVKKANMGVDETLAGEVKQALLLAHYSGKLTPGTSVAVYYGDTAVEVGDDSAGAAMLACFGEGWEDLHLKYDGWDEEMGPLTDGEMIEYIEGSTFDANPENLGNLLNDVQHVVGLLGNFFNVGGNATGDLKEFLESNNLPTSGDGTTMANATVMYVADNLKNVMAGTTESGESNADVFAKEWAALGAEGISLPTFSNLDDAFAQTAAQYAYVEALAQHMDAEAGTSYVDILNDASQNVSDRDAMTKAMASVIGQINEGAASSEDPAFQSALAAYYGMDAEGNVVAENSMAYKNAMAFTGYMQGVSASTDSLLGNTDLTKENYYSDGEILDYVNNYVEIGKTMQGMSVGNGAFVFYYNGNKVVCAPLDY